MMSTIIEINQDNPEGPEITRMLVMQCFPNRKITKRSLSMIIIDLNFLHFLERKLFVNLFYNC